MSSPDPPLPENPSADQLGRSYEDLIEQSGGESEPLTEIEPSPTPAVPDTPPPPMRIVEALLFVGGEPLTAARVCEIMRGLTPEQFSQAVDTLNRDYRRQGRPYVIL